MEDKETAPEPPHPETHSACADGRGCNGRKPAEAPTELGPQATPTYRYSCIIVSLVSYFFHKIIFTFFVFIFLIVFGHCNALLLVHVKL